MYTFFHPHPPPPLQSISPSVQEKYSAKMALWSICQWNARSSFTEAITLSAIPCHTQQFIRYSQRRTKINHSPTHSSTLPGQCCHLESTDETTPLIYSKDAKKQGQLLSKALHSKSTSNHLQHTGQQFHYSQRCVHFNCRAHIWGIIFSFAPDQQ